MRRRYEGIGFCCADFGIDRSCWSCCSRHNTTNLAFEPPTPADNSVIDKNYVEIKVSVENAADLNTFIFNWNGEDYIIYDDSLVLCLNFNNNSAIGENATHVVDVSKYGNTRLLYVPSYSLSICLEEPPQT